MSELNRRKPRVLIVGGPDVDQRLELMRRLRPTFDMSAAGSEPGVAGRFEAEGFAFHSYHLTRGANPLDDLRSLASLVRVIGRARPQVVHAFATKPSVWGRLAAAVLRVPVIIGTLPGLGSLYTPAGRRARLVRWVYEKLQTAACRSSHMTLFQNHHDLEELVERGVALAQQSGVIPGSGVRTDYYSRDAVNAAEVRSVRSEIGASDGDVVVTMVSRLIRAKGVEEFAAASSVVRRNHPEARFALVGPEDLDSMDSLPPDVLEAVRRQVTWLGERADIRTILAASQVFALPTNYREGMPRVLLEAAAMSLPLVTTRAPGCADVVDDGVNGLLVNGQDIDELASAIAGLVSDPDRRSRLGEASRRRALTEFDSAVIAAETERLYLRLLAGRAPGYDTARQPIGGSR